LRSIFLPGSPVRVGEPINLIYNESINPINKDLLDLHDALANETHWAKLPYIPQDMQAMIDFITSTPKPITISYFERWRDHPISFATVAMIVMVIAMGIVLLYYIRTKKTARTHITIAMPSMKELEALQD
jgi:hypothetical protein